MLRSVVFFFASAALFAAPSKPNFSGKWRLDQGRSSREAPAALVETIDHREPALRIDSDWDHNVATGVTNAAILAPAMQLTTDETEATSEMPLGMSLVTKSRWDGNKLVTEWRVNGLQRPLSGTWTRYLTGPNTMVVDSAAGQVREKLVFGK
jgi:hypothetical protein